MLFKHAFILILILLFKSTLVNSQTIFYQEILYGGVTVDGFTTTLGAGTGTMTLSIPPSSVISKAFLFCGRHGDPNPITVIFNGGSITYDNYTSISSHFLSPLYAGIGGEGSVHMVDVSDYVSSTQLNYQIIVPPQLNSNIRYTDFYLVIIYSNNMLPKTTCSVFINNNDIGQFMNYFITDLNPIKTINDVGLSIHGGYMCDTVIEPTIVHLNSSIIGKIGGNDYNGGYICGGVVGSFSYQNNQLFGLGDDTPDAFMKSSDGLANINGYISNLTTSLNAVFEVQSNNHDNWFSNPVWGVTLTYTTPCDTFTTHLLTEDTTVCRGNTVQLGASGGNTSLSKPTYEWLPQKDLSCYDCANPVFSGDSSQVYTVRIWNTDSCSKVLPVRVKVLPQPEFGKITTKNSVCGAQSGALTVNTPPQDSLFLDSVFVGNTPHTQNNLGAGLHHLYLKDSMGCKSQDTLVSIESTNNTQALFSLNPQTGAAPLSVTTDNQSTNAIDYLWYFLGDSTTAYAPTIQFDTSGTYSVTLLAYQNDISCADTFSLTITVYDSLQVIVPNIITANGDGQNDVFSIQVNAPCKGTVNIVNRWGNEVFRKDFTAQGKEKVLLWDGTSQGQKVDDGVYFYLFKLQDQKGEMHKLEGFLSVVH